MLIPIVQSLVPRASHAMREVDLVVWSHRRETCPQKVLVLSALVVTPSQVVLGVTSRDLRAHEEVAHEAATGRRVVWVLATAVGVVGLIVVRCVEGLRLRDGGRDLPP